MPRTGIDSATGSNRTSTPIVRVDVPSHGCGNEPVATNVANS